MQFGEVVRVRLLRVRDVGKADAADLGDGSKRLPLIRRLPAASLELRPRGDDRLAGARLLR